MMQMLCYDNATTQISHSIILVLLCMILHSINTYVICYEFVYAVHYTRYTCSCGEDYCLR